MTAKAKSVPRRGDHVLVLTMAGDGPVYVPHTPQEYATLMHDVAVAESLMIWEWRGR